MYDVYNLMRQPHQIIHVVHLSAAVLVIFGFGLEGPREVTVVLHLVHLVLLVMALAGSVCTVASVALLLLAGTKPSRASAVLASRRCWSAEGVGHVVLLLLACCRWRRDFF